VSWKLNQRPFPRAAIQGFPTQGRAALDPRLMDMAVQLLEIPEATILQAVEAKLDEGNLTADLIEGKEAVYLSAPLCQDRCRLPQGECVSL
jgi:hypothetical protein